ncbi:MAG: hypothetical protein IPL78_34505 [Chloroflexi bacterium]|nr:hypothetical protein [Chloroflexota bacterium]
MAAYTAQAPDLRPADVGDADLTVRGVISWYGPTDMNVYYNYAGNVFSAVVGQSDKRAQTRLTSGLPKSWGLTQHL